MARAALFDAGDTLLHWNVHKRERFLWLCQQVGVPLPDDTATRLRAARAAEQFFYRELQRPDSWSEAWWVDHSAAGLAQLGTVPAPRARELALRIGRLRSSLPNHFVLDPDAMPLLAELRARGFKIGLVSNWDGTLAETCAAAGLTEYIDYIGDSTVFGQAKPSAAFFEHVLSQLGAKPSDAFHVGDHYDADVAGARAAGVTPILLDVFEYEERHCELRVRGLNEVPDVLTRLWSDGVAAS